MTRIRRILNIFSREVDRGRPSAPLPGEDLVAFVRAATDPHIIDTVLQQAGRAPFWPQDQRMLRFYHAAQTDRPLSVRLKAAADINIAARRHALAHMHMTPDPMGESHLPRRQYALLHLMAADAASPENSRSFLRQLRQPQNARVLGNSVSRDMAATFGGDITAGLQAGLEPVAALRALVTEQLGDMLRAWLRAACDGALPARLDAALRGALEQQDHAAFAHLRIEIAATPRLTSGDRAGGMEATDLLAHLLTGMETMAVEPAMVCRDDRGLVQRGFGSRTDIESYVMWVNDDIAANLTRFSELMARRLTSSASHMHMVAPSDDTPQSVGITVMTAETAPVRLIECQHPYEALVEMSLFARLIGHQSGNRGLRQYWQKHEEAGGPLRIGSLMGLVLGDLQNVYEQMTRRDIYQATPDLRRLQDRMLARSLTPQPAMAMDGNDSA